MSLIRHVMGIEESDLSVESLTGYFSEEREESAYLEFKEGRAKIEKLFKEIVAFLNSDGGILVWGAPREVDVDGRQVVKGGLTGLPLGGIKKDDLLRKINGNITPLPVGIRIHDCSDARTRVIVIDVPKSAHAPHQSSDHRYYLRIDSESRPAPHGIVEALFFRRQSPNIQIQIEPISDSIVGKVLLVHISNASEFPASDIQLFAQVIGSEFVECSSGTVQYVTDWIYSLYYRSSERIYRTLILSIEVALSNPHDTVFVELTCDCKEQSKALSQVYKINCTDMTVEETATIEEDGYRFLQAEREVFVDALPDHYSILERRFVTTIRDDPGTLKLRWRLSQAATGIEGTMRHDHQSTLSEVLATFHLYDLHDLFVGKVDKLFAAVGAAEGHRFSLSVNHGVMMSIKRIDVELVRNPYGHRGGTPLESVTEEE